MPHALHGTTSIVSMSADGEAGNLAQVFEAVFRRHMRHQHNSVNFVEYIWLRRVLHYFSQSSLGIHVSDTLDSLNLTQISDPRVSPPLQSAHRQRAMHRDHASEGESSSDDAFAQEAVSGAESRERLYSGTDGSSPVKVGSQGQGTSENTSTYISVFTFLDAVRLHKSVEEIEKHRMVPPKDAARRDSPEEVNTEISQLGINVAEMFAWTGQGQTYPQASQGNNPTQTTAVGIKSRPMRLPPHIQQRQEYSYTYGYPDALKYAIMYGHVQYSEFLLVNHLEEALVETVCCPLLLLAVRLDQRRIVDQLCLHSGRKHRHNHYINKRGCSAMEGGRSALHVAAELGNVDILKVLLQYGARADSEDDMGHTSLDRLLYRLQPPHITFKTVQCARQLVKHLSYLSVYQHAALVRLIQVSTTPPCPLDTAVDLLDLPPGPFSLKHLCRWAVRHRIGYPLLPGATSRLGLPPSLINYINLMD